MKKEAKRSFVFDIRNEMGSNKQEEGNVELLNFSTNGKNGNVYKYRQLCFSDLETNTIWIRLDLFVFELSVAKDKKEYS